MLCSKMLGTTFMKNTSSNSAHTGHTKNNKIRWWNSNRIGYQQICITKQTKLNKPLIPLSTAFKSSLNHHLRPLKSPQLQLHGGTSGRDRRPPRRRGETPLARASHGQIKKKMKEKKRRKKWSGVGGRGLPTENENGGERMGQRSLMGQKVAPRVAILRNGPFCPWSNGP